MRVRFLQSGGLVGAARGCELDSARLEPDDARELLELVKASGLMASGKFLSAAGRDLRLYEIEVESDSGTVAVTFDDHTLPEKARPLVSFLKRNARPQDRGAT